MHPLYDEMMRLLNRRDSEQIACKRKVVVTAIYIDRGPPSMEYQKIAERVNGGPECTNEVGACGCGHSEPRAIMDVMRQWMPRNHRTFVLLVTHSPCSFCANVIADSNIIKEVYYHDLTMHDQRGVQIMEREGVLVRQI